MVRKILIAGAGIGGLTAASCLMKAGYDVRLASGVTCAGGCLGIMIPPSILLIVYGAQAGVSTVKLYAGALLPGFLLAGLYILYVIGFAIVKPSAAPKLGAEHRNVGFLQAVKLLATSFFPLAFLILAVLGSIMFGLATPTEAAAVGAFGSILLAAGYRALHQDYDHNDFEWDVTMHGPVLGAVLRF